MLRSSAWSSRNSRRTPRRGFPADRRRNRAGWPGRFVGGAPAARSAAAGGACEVISLGFVGQHRRATPPAARSPAVGGTAPGPRPGPRRRSPKPSSCRRNPSMAARSARRPRRVARRPWWCRAARSGGPGGAPGGQIGHDPAELHLLLRQLGAVLEGAEEDRADGGAPPADRHHGDGLDPAAGEHREDAGEGGIPGGVGDVDHLAGLQGTAQLGVAVQIHHVVPDSRILVARHQVDRAAAALRQKHRQRSSPNVFPSRRATVWTMST